MQDTGSLGLVHWDDPEGWYGEGGGNPGIDPMSLMSPALAGRFFTTSTSCTRGDGKLLLEGPECPQKITKAFQKNQYNIVISLSLK